MFIISIHLLLLSNLNFFPYPELFIYSYLTKQGLLPYSQIFDQHFPGIMFFPVNLATLGIDTVNEMRILHLTLVVLTHILLFLVSKKLFKSNIYSLLTNFLYFVWQPFFEGYVLWIDSFIPVFLLSSMYLLMENKINDTRYVFSGVFIGVAMLFKQVVLPTFALVSIYLYFKSGKQTFYKFLIGFSISLVFLFIYILSTKAVSDFIYWTFTFNLTTFSDMGRKLPLFIDLIKVIPVFGAATICVLYFLINRLKSNIILSGLLMLGSFTFVYARWDYIHLQPALVFAVIILVYSLKLLTKATKILTIIVYLPVALYLLIPFYRANMGSRVLFFGEFEQKISEEVLKLANPGDSVFAFGTTPHLYQLTKTIPPGNVFVFQFPWFMKIAEEKVYQGILQDPPKVIVRDKNSEVSDMNLVKFMPKISQYVETNYIIVNKVDTIDILIPK